MIVAARRALDGGAADYVAFATGARVLASGSRCLYCLREQTLAQVAVLGYRPPPPAPGFPAPYANPPLAAWLLQPLAARPLTTALPLFIAALVAGLLLAAVLFLCRLSPALSRPFGCDLMLVALAVLSLPGAVSLLAVAAGRDLLAGLAASLIFVKPQLGLLLGLAVVLTARRRLITGFGLGALVWAASTLALVGPTGVVQWGRYVDARLGPQATYARGLAGLAAGFGGDARAVELTGLGLVIALAAGAIALRARLRANLQAALALGVAASLCCTPHVFSDDMLLLAPALVIWGGHRLAPALIAALALNLAFVLDEYLLPGRFQRIEGLVALGVVVGLTATLQRRSGRAQDGPIDAHRHPARSAEPHNEVVPSPSRSLPQCFCAPLPLPSPASP